MMRRLLRRVSASLPCRIISDSDVPYLERYFVCRALGVTVYLHRFVGSDPARGLHDHPWRWAVSLILAGHYVEMNRYGLRPVRWFNVLSGDSFHRVLLPSGTDVWSLFIHRSGRVKPWGFLKDAGQMGIVYRVHHAEAADDWWLTAPKGRDESRRQP